MNLPRIAILVILTLFLIGCAGPLQAPAALPNQPSSPTQTPEPTPLPYNLDLLVKDPQGQPIPGASAQLGDQTVQAGSSGVISFSDLGAGPLALTVSASGYLPQQLSPQLQPGDNQLEAVLEPEPREPTATPQSTPETAAGYALSLKLTDIDGQPLSLASVSLLDADGQPIGDPLAPDAAGMLALSDLPGGVITLAVSAPGYLPLEQGLIIEIGEPAALTLALERDTLGLAPSEACASNEKLLYIEDFNDGQAQGWRNVSQAVESNLGGEVNHQNGWSILEQPNGNMLLQAADSLSPAADSLENFTFDEAVWRIKVSFTGDDTDGFLNWRQSFVDESGLNGDWRYFIPYGGPQRLSLIRFASGEAVQAAQSNVQLAPETWHLFEISTYQGVTEVWLDSRLLFSYADPQPLPPGTIGLELHLREGVETVFWFDDLAVCGLAEPFVPLSRAP